MSGPCSSYYRSGNSVLRGGMGAAPHKVPENPDNWGGSLLVIFFRTLSPLPQARVVGSSQMYPGILILEMCPVVLIHGFYEFVMT